MAQGSDLPMIREELAPRIAEKINRRTGVTYAEAERLAHEIIATVAAALYPLQAGGDGEGPGGAS